MILEPSVTLENSDVSASHFPVLSHTLPDSLIPLPHGFCMLQGRYKTLVKISIGNREKERVNWSPTWFCLHPLGGKNPLLSPLFACYGQSTRVPPLAPSLSLFFSDQGRGGVNQDGYAVAHDVLYQNTSVQNTHGFREKDS